MSGDSTKRRQRVETGHVRQSFSHGRTKQVVVERKRPRAADASAAPEKARTKPDAKASDKADAKPAVKSATRSATGAAAAAKKSVAATSGGGRTARMASKPAAQSPARRQAVRQEGGGAGATRSASKDAKSGKTSAARSASRASPRERRAAGGLILRTLTEEEKQARSRALSQARERERQEREEAQRRAQQAAEEVQRRKREAEEAQRKLEDERVRREAEEISRRVAEAQAQRRLEVTPEVEAPPQPQQETGRHGPARSHGKRQRGGAAPARSPQRRRPGEQRGRAGGGKPGGKLTLSNALADNERQRSLSALRRQQERGRARGTTTPEQPPAPARKISREVVIPERITIQELANRMAERAVDVIKILMQQGGMAKITDAIDSDTAQLIAEEMGHTVKRVAESDVEDIIGSLREQKAEQHPRAPIITVMGHVDHGKTSLLDMLRKSNVAARESGGITQHIGAYRVSLAANDSITFLDTPGHAAFAAMRARGARLTDIVVLVVAADDGVMPQTEEAIRHAREARVPLIVAINKIDKPGADIDRVRQDLLRHEVITEEMGGDVLSVPLSAKTGSGLDKLLEAIGLQAELMELQAAVDCPAAGVVLEARMEHGRGHTATLLVQRGRLQIGDIFVAGAQWGRVRALKDDRGAAVKGAGPSTPVEVMGLGGTPSAGDGFTVLPSEVQAREIVAYRQRMQTERRVGGIIHGGNRLEDLMNGAAADAKSPLQEARGEEFPLLVKADVQGSAEAVSQMLGELQVDEARARVVYSGVGDISESDVTLAATSKAMIVGFNVRLGGGVHGSARTVAERMGVEIRRYSVIYNLMDDVRAALAGTLAPQMEETRLGEGRVLEIFDISKLGKVAGCRIEDGQIRRAARVRLLRTGESVYEGALASLRRFKDEVREVNAGQECGMAFENFQDFRQGDVVECFEVKEVARESV